MRPLPRRLPGLAGPVKRLMWWGIEMLYSLVLTVTVWRESRKVWKER